MEKKSTNNKSAEIAGRVFDTSDYQKGDALSSGLATTHEQVSDTYMEGEVGAVSDDANGQDTAKDEK
ncbi:YozQ family protein [Neobacillus rhizosphaerae]|uniref:YozQ family protein n=1 Tax=Neobacillus rhizosphaerae TaxID=2880965 RepID=UPI003D2AD4A6